MPPAGRKHGAPATETRGPQPPSTGATSVHHLDFSEEIPIKVVGKIGKILDAFRSEGAELSLGSISSAAGIGLSTTSRLVASLVRVGLLRYDPVQRLYTPGLIMLELSRAVLTRFSFRELAHRELVALATETGWQTYLAVADESDDHSLIYIDAVSITTPELSEIGQRRTMHSTATGKVLLAFKGISVAGWKPQSSTHFTHTDGKELDRELAEVRVKGFAISVQEEHLNMSSAAAPIYDAEGRVLAAFGIGTTPAVFAENSQRIIATVVNKARGITSAIGLSDSAAG